MSLNGLNQNHREPDQVRMLRGPRQKNAALLVAEKRLDAQ
ncbi:hypothetical protein BN903_35 [Halorubrum sp. AJ67]|nr:hypothetical protein BN903_35 [Halorubrum sp. AJ67]